MLDWLLWWQQRGGPASDWLSSVLNEYVGEDDLEVKHQAGNQVTLLSNIHCASFDVWVRDLGHYKVPALSPRCIWHMGTTQDLEDSLLYTRHVSNAEVRRTTGCSLLSHLVTNRCLRLFGYNCSQFTSRGPPSSPCSVYTRQDRPTGSDQQEDPATLGCVQLRQTLALWTLASQLPGEILERNGDILWTQQVQQRSSGVRSEWRKKEVTSKVWGGGICVGL